MQHTLICSGSDQTHVFVGLICQRQRIYKIKERKYLQQIMKGNDVEGPSRIFPIVDRYTSYKHICETREECTRKKVSGGTVEVDCM